MNEVWLDTNVILRFVLGEPAGQFERARRLMRRAASGEVVARVAHVTIAEAVWVLATAYERDRSAIAESLGAFIRADGISIEETDLVLDALRRMSEANVAFVDAYVAAVARERGQAVATFDTDFRRLAVDLEEI